MNEAADRLANFHAEAGPGEEESNKVTEEGLKEWSKFIRAASRTHPTFGAGVTEWGVHALAAFTWLRINRGPQAYWLHKVGRRADPSCSSCAHPTEDGDHVTFHCHSLASSRAALLGDRRTWEELDPLNWIEIPGSEGEDRIMVNGVEEFFQDTYWHLTRGRGTVG